MALPNTYVAGSNSTISTAITILQVTAASTKPLQIIRAWVNQGSITTSNQIAVELLRKTGTATVTSLTPLKLNPADGAAGATAGKIATVEGTDGDVIPNDGFNTLNGWLYLPLPEERIIVAASGIIALKFNVAPPSATYYYGMIFQEIG